MDLLGRDFSPSSGGNDEGVAWLGQILRGDSKIFEMLVDLKMAVIRFVSKRSIHAKYGTNRAKVSKYGMFMGEGVRTLRAAGAMRVPSSCWVNLPLRIYGNTTSHSEFQVFGKHRVA
ncbi:MAG: hypothetical protein ACJAQT_002288 [Akkermansiaceae bacterium]|jgi:hypothetical protein